MKRYCGSLKVSVDNNHVILQLCKVLIVLCVKRYINLKILVCSPWFGTISNVEVLFVLILVYKKTYGYVCSIVNGELFAHRKTLLEIPRSNRDMTCVITSYANMNFHSDIRLSIVFWFSKSTNLTVGFSHSPQLFKFQFQ